MVKKYLRKKEGAFEPHMMFNPKTGEGFFAEKEEDHLRMDAMGFTHVKPKSYMSHGGMNCGCGMDPCKTYGVSNEMKEKFKEKWPVSEWEKFDEELAILEVDVEGAPTPEDMEMALEELNERMEFRRWKKANDLKVIQKELAKASNTHKTQSQIIEAINRNYSRRNSAMFNRSTGLYRKFGGKRFILDDVYGTRDQARYMAGYWRARGMNARVIPVKNGSAIYVREKGQSGRLLRPMIRRRGK